MGACNCSLRSTFHVDAKILDGLSANRKLVCSSLTCHLADSVLTGKYLYCNFRALIRKQMSSSELAARLQ